MWTKTPRKQNRGSVFGKGQHIIHTPEAHWFKHSCLELYHWGYVLIDLMTLSFKTYTYTHFNAENEYYFGIFREDILTCYKIKSTNLRHCVFLQCVTLEIHLYYLPTSLSTPESPPPFTSLSLYLSYPFFPLFLTKPNQTLHKLWSKTSAHVFDSLHTQWITVSWQKQ